MNDIVEFAERQVVQESVPFGGDVRWNIFLDYNTLVKETSRSGIDWGKATDPRASISLDYQERWFLKNDNHNIQDLPIANEDVNNVLHAFFMQQAKRTTIVAAKEKL